MCQLCIFILSVTVFMVDINRLVLLVHENTHIAKYAYCGFIYKSIKNEIHTSISQHSHRILNFYLRISYTNHIFAQLFIYFSKLRKNMTYLKSFKIKDCEVSENICQYRVLECFRLISK